MYKCWIYAGNTFGERRLAEDKEFGDSNGIEGNHRREKFIREVYLKFFVDMVGNKRYGKVGKDLNRLLKSTRQ